MLLAPLGAGGSELFILSTKPPLESSTLLSLFSVSSGLGPVPPSLLRSEVRDALRVLFVRYLLALPKGALCLTP